MASPALSDEIFFRETAGTYMVTHIPRAFTGTSIKTVIESLHGNRFECADTVFVTDDDGRLEGIVRISELFANLDGPIGDIMEPEHEAVQTGDDQEQIAVLAMRLNMIAIPVVDKDDRLIGAVPPESLFRILRAEHMEDLQRFAGIVAHEEGPHVALDASLYNRFRRRLPWLVFGLIASSFITALMTGFEQTLSENVAVAFFVPALVYVAGAIGSQAVSVAVRGLSTENISIGRLLQDEIIIGLAIGLTLGTITFVSVFVFFGDIALSLAVGLAVLGGGAVSAVVGFVLPWSFQRLGSDPALGSGPVCTIVQDVASLSLYFVLVITLVI
jgi:magnesium transporter